MRSKVSAERMSEFVYEPAERTIVVPKPALRAAGGVFTIRVPALFGAIESVERRGSYIVVRAEQGKASYHYAPKQGKVMEERRVGFMVWNSLRKTIRGLCLDPRFAKRVDMHVLYFRNDMVKGGSGSSAVGVSGRVTVDKRVVAEDNALGFALGPSLERYLHLEPGARLVDEDPLIRAFALLDRDTQTQEPPVSAQDREQPLWASFWALREAARASDI